MDFLVIKKIYDKFTGVWEDSEDLGQRAVRGGAILFLSKFLTKGVAFIRTIIIARLLLPQDLGLFGLASLAIATTGVFFQTGFHEAIIQEKGDVKKHLDSAWTVTMMTNLVLAAVIFFVSAPLAGHFFHNESAVLITKILALMFVIQAFDNIGTVLFQRDLQFNRQFIYFAVGFTGQAAVTILAAWYFRNYWGLVVGAIAGKMLYLILAYILSSYKPRFDFSFIGAKHLFRYGKWVGITGVVTFFISQGDYITIGRMLNAPTLAFYQLAFSLGTLPAIEIVGVFATILFPLYANIQGDRERLRSVFMRISRLVFVLSIPASVGLLVMAREVVTFVYGSKWLPMVPILYVIIIYGLIKAFELITEPLFRGIGKPHISTSVTVVQFAVMFAFIIPMTRMYGPVGTAWSVFFGFITAQAIFLFQLKREVSIGIGSVLRASIVPLISSGLMGLILFLTKNQIAVNTKTLLVLFVAFGALVYVVIAWLLDRLAGGEIYQSIMWVREKL